jgi:hypothetical protein
MFPVQETQWLTSALIAGLHTLFQSALLVLISAVRFEQRWRPGRDLRSNSLGSSRTTPSSFSSSALWIREGTGFIVRSLIQKWFLLHVIPILIYLRYTYALTLFSRFGDI